MSKKQDLSAYFPDEDSFSSNDDFILNYRPVIDFVEPDQTPAEAPSEEVIPTLDTAISDTQEVISGLKAVAALAEEVQRRVTNRVASSGGVDIKLDPIKDYSTISAMKRKFPDRADPSVITYEDYLAALECLQKQATSPQSVTAADIMSAQQDPLRTDFGGYSNQNGENRAEISSSASSVQPLDIESFQKQGILALFAMLRPLVIKEIVNQVPKLVGF